ncbi:hypothetical protein Nepgr_010813 [Nepenthes gracilis]|uniref:Hydroxyproline-rich glycoprotein family protein n=1 Tax=Nepenthes gracilis TaxID=150966 RepID=A0AAD3SD34_NEPGR|nr:hypothetical protein Nepgr_010813 [Nepenthes gracilis]
MTSINNSVETVTAAAAAIVTAESRVQPAPVQKKRWGSCWSTYWCFGSQKISKRVGHSALVPESTGHGRAVPVVENLNHPTSVVLPFIAPPSSPSYFLQSDPPNATHSPDGLLSFTSLSAASNSPSGPANIFAAGPYAHETQLVSPPVFSAFTTEPSTAGVTPPPEPVQLTTPPSPEVPFAQLLTPSLNRTRRNSGHNQKHPLSYYEFHQFYSGSPAGNLRSPGSANSASGTSSPIPVRHAILAFHMADASKLFEKFTTRKWYSGLGSGSLTPDGTVGPASRDYPPPENQVSELASLANSETGSQAEETLVDHRVSFKLTAEDIPTCLEKKEISSLETVADEGCNGVLRKVESCCKLYVVEASDQTLQTGSGVAKDCKHKHSSISFGSVKEFNFDSSEIEVPGEPTVSSKWWADGEVEKDIGAQNNWTFFPLLQPGFS